MSVSQLDAATRLDIADVVMRYATAIDTRDWQLFRTAFTADCVCDYGEIGRWQGLDEFATFMEQIHNRCGFSLHRLSNIVLTQDDSDVRSRSYVDALVLNPDNESGTRIAGYYDDRLVATPDGWRIAERTCTTIFLSAATKLG
jgi:3-phenylpropionate/cinnamic acid dioxygenase small subunit